MKLLKLLDVKGNTHYIREEDIKFIKINKEVENDNDGEPFWGYVYVEGRYINLGKEGVEMVKEWKLLNN